MEKITTIGLDLAKSFFRFISEEGAVIVRRALRRSQVLDFFRKLQPCRVGMGGLRQRALLCQLDR